MVDNLLGIHGRRTRHTALWIGLSERLLLAIECEQSSRGKLPSWFRHCLRHYPCLRPVRLRPPILVGHRNGDRVIRRTHHVRDRSVRLTRSSSDSDTILRRCAHDIRSHASSNKRPPSQSSGSRSCSDRSSPMIGSKTCLSDIIVSINALTGVQSPIYPNVASAGLCHRRTPVISEHGTAGFFRLSQIRLCTCSGRHRKRHCEDRQALEHQGV